LPVAVLANAGATASDKVHVRTRQRNPRIMGSGPQSKRAAYLPRIKRG
jgi:hypothetical protein